MEINFNLLLSIKWDLHHDCGPLLFIAHVIAKNYMVPLKVYSSLAIWHAGNIYNFFSLQLIKRCQIVIILLLYGFIINFTSIIIVEPGLEIK